MDINDLTIRQAKELSEMFKGNPLDVPAHDIGPWQVGKNYLIRTVTMIVTGELVSVSSQELVLKSAAWVADTGRFHEALRDITKCGEVEPFLNPAIVGRGAVIDATIISGLLTEAK